MNAISVFISYSHQDRAFVDDLAIGLQKAGVAVWYDPSLRGGDVWPQELADQIDRADAVVAVISAAFNQSDWARKEIVYAQGKKKHVVPFRLDAEPPIWLNDIQYVTTPDELLAALKGTPVPHAPRALKRTLPTHELAIEFVDSKDAPDDKPIPFVMSVTGTRMRMNGEFVSPLDQSVLADIRWYLELYPQWPSGPDYDRAQRIETNLPKWGEALLASLVKDGKVRDIYRQFERKEDVSHVLTITANEPRVLQLPWELLAEEGGFLFAKDISIRRGLPISLDEKEKAKFDLPIRVLMVVSRPDDKDVGFLDPRSSAQALLDALDELGDAVEVDFLRPPTLAALDAALKSQTYHIVHFDGHGVYDRVRGLGLLLFERGDYSLDEVDANQFGTLMNRRNIPLVILDACQTAMQDQRELTSVAAKLIEAGVGSVLAMNYSVLVPTTRKFSAAFYHALANGATISAATEQGRRALAADKYRLSIYRNGKNEKIDLQDWFLPALYQQASDPALFAHADGGRTTKDESRSSSVVRPPSFVPTQPERGGFPDAPLHGFKGRMRELLDLERLMLPSRDANDRDKPAHRIVVLHGWGGQGKTALATEAAHWFVRTGLFERAVFVSFEKGGGLELGLGELGNALVSDDFAIHSGDPIATIETALCEKPTLVVWDNFESLISDGNAPLDDKALQELLDAGARWSRALELREQLGNPVEIARDCNNLADLLLAQGRVDEAERLALRAVTIKETLDLSSTPWTTYNILRGLRNSVHLKIPRALRERWTRRAWRRKERESFAAFAGADQQIAWWQPVIAAVHGNQEARQQVEQLCAQFESADEVNKRFAGALRRILAGERDYEALADSLNLSRTAALIVRKIVSGLGNG